MTTRITFMSLALLLAIGLSGCGSSPEDQITESIEKILEADIEDVSARMKQRTGGGVSEVVLSDYEPGDRRVSAEITYESGVTEEARVPVEKVDGQWRARH